MNRHWSRQVILFTPSFFVTSGINGVLAVITKIYGGIQVMEIWKDIKGYEGQYKVSNKGRVKSLYRGKERILKPYKDRDGYLRLKLCKDGQYRKYFIHRLVTQAFIPNPNGYPCVNHKDESKENNSVDNLEWCSVAYNNNYGSRNERVAKTQTNRKDCSKPVLGISKDKKNYLYFNSTKDAQRLGGFSHGCISQCCRGKLKTHKGYTWMYADSQE